MRSTAVFFQMDEHNRGAKISAAISRRNKERKGGNPTLNINWLKRFKPGNSEIMSREWFQLTVAKRWLMMIEKKADVGKCWVNEKLGLSTAELNKFKWLNRNNKWSLQSCSWQIRCFSSNFGFPVCCEEWVTVSKNRWAKLEEESLERIRGFNCCQKAFDRKLNEKSNSIFICNTCFLLYWKKHFSSFDWGDSVIKSEKNLRASDFF